MMYSKIIFKYKLKNLRVISIVNFTLCNLIIFVFLSLGTFFELIFVYFSDIVFQ